MNDDPRMAIWHVLNEVAAERVHQIDDLGFDAEHDARMRRTDFGWLLARRAVDLCAPEALIVDERRTLLEIAAIAAAGVEAVDRRDHDQYGPTETARAREGNGVTQGW